MSNTEHDEVHGLVAHLFRQQAGQLMASITRLLGSSRLDLTEDIVQETILRALSHWPFHGVPDNPAGWLTTVAKRIALDKLKHQAMQSRASESVARRLEEVLSRAVVTPDPKFNCELRDDLLAMMFACCRCEQSEATRIALILHLLCGFSAKELAGLFLVDEPAIAQRLVRAKKSLRESGVSLDGPRETEITGGLDTVLAAIYGMFNEGYKATSGDNLVSEDLCDEAIRLAQILHEHQAAKGPKTYALLALFYFQHSRLRARVDSDGILLTLADQDRTLWNRDEIVMGLKFLDLAAVDGTLSRYHLEAAIASCHASAESYAMSNWGQILEFYDTLVMLESSLVVQLNRIVAVSMAIGPTEAINQLERLGEFSRLSKSHLFHATRGELLRSIGNADGARKSFESALELCDNEIERGFLRRKISET